MKLSIITPIYNESQNLGQLFKEIKDVLSCQDFDYEIITINDGSKDGSLAVLEMEARNDKRVKVINFSRNFGQTAAMSAGIKMATGDIIIPLDADLQNDPADIPRFLEKINEGYDVVSGWRKNRKDKLFLRKIPSWIANWIIGLITGVKIHDYGCSIKAYKKEAIQEVNLYGEMHRFIPAYIAWGGGSVSEISVNHRPRIHGETKYGLSRTFRVILDIILIKFLSKYMNRPMHFFGGIGFMALTLGFLSGLVAIGLRLFINLHLVETPLPVLATLLIIVGAQFIVMGVLSEILMRTYYESQHKDYYSIKNKINF